MVYLEDSNDLYWPWMTLIDFYVKYRCPGQIELQFMSFIMVYLEAKSLWIGSNSIFSLYFCFSLYFQPLFFIIMLHKILHFKWLFGEYDEKVSFRYLKLTFFYVELRECSQRGDYITNPRVNFATFRFIFIFVHPFERFWWGFGGQGPERTLIWWPWTD